MNTLIHATTQGSRLARAWSAVAGAAATDKDRPALYRTTYLEQHLTGVRLTACDGYWSASAWVGDLVDPDDPTSGHHTAPKATAPPLVAVAVVDQDLRILGLMRYVVGLTVKLDPVTHPDIPVTIHVTDEEPAADTLPDLDRDVVRVDIPGAEHVNGAVNEVDYPNISRLVALTVDEAGAVDEVAVAAKVLRGVAGAVERAGGAALELRFASSKKTAIRWQAIELAACELSGLAMPLRPKVESPAT